MSEEASKKLLSPKANYNQHTTPTTVTVRLSDNDLTFPPISFP
jgi:hypothetical protein